MKTIAIIPARSGSKGLKDKNIKMLKGKPLMAYTIENAINSGVFDEVMVSTDSEEYASIAKKYGAKVPFLRSEELSSDKADSWSVVKEVLNRYNERFDVVCLLQPTSPLRLACDIVGAYELYKNKKANVVISVCEMEHSPLLCGKLDNEQSLKSFIKNNNLKRRQDLDIYYRLNGAIYFVDIDYLFSDGELYAENSFAYIMPKERSVDIDSLLDFKMAELYLDEN